MLNLKRPIVFLDIEATGLDLEKDKIIELCLCKINPDGTRILKTTRYNPGIPIPPEATEIHGIKDDDVKDRSFFKQHAKGILTFIEDCDIAGFNSNRYDVPLLFNELNNAGCYFDHSKANLVDVGNIFKIKEPRTLEAGVKFYLDCDHEGAHGAEADVLATINVFLKQIEKYELPEDMGELALLSNFDKPILDLSGKFTMNKDGIICFTFGKYKDQPAKNHLDFLDWMLNKATFPKDTCAIAQDVINQTMFNNQENYL